MFGGSAIVFQYSFGLVAVFDFIESNTDIAVNICKQSYVFGKEGV